MPAFFLAFLACAMAVFAGRESISVARLSAALHHGRGLLAAVWLSSIASSALAAGLGAALAPQLFFEAKLVFVAVALILGGVELLVLRPRAQPREPTRSFGAILLVLTASQITDAARFLVLAAALATGVPVLAGIGGALAGGMVLSLAWSMGAQWERCLPTGGIRLGAAGLMAAGGIWTLLRGIGLIG